MSLAAQYNATRTRDDCEWIDTPDGGAMLTQTRRWTEQHTRDLARRAEADRRQHAHRQNYPVTAPREGWAD